MLGQYHRHFSVLFVRVQAACLTARLSHLGLESREMAGRRREPHGTGAERQEGGRGLPHGLRERTGKDGNLAERNMLPIFNVFL